MLYYYEGRCPRSGVWLRLPRSSASEAAARQLMAELALLPSTEGKMYGVLLVTNANGQQQILKAFSGLWQGQSEQPGWVPPIPGRQQVAPAEVDTLTQLTAIHQKIAQLQAWPGRSQYTQLQAEYAQARQDLSTQLQYRRQTRQQQRQTYATQLAGTELQAALQQLDRESQEDSTTKRRCKQQWEKQLHPLQHELEAVDRQIQLLKNQRKTLSQKLQAHMHQAATLTNFAGESRTLDQLRPQGLPTGSGECCAPKLLHYAAIHDLQPIGLAEFWWGPPIGDKKSGEFYGACADRCQPLLGFMLSGLSAKIRASSNHSALEVIYRDDNLLVVNKPSGLLAVPGRYGQENVLEYLKADNKMPLWAVHRLDQDTSGILILAKDIATYRALSRQFANRAVTKIYEALLAGMLPTDAGSIDLPLAADWDNRPRQKVDWQRGKPCVTHYQVLGTHNNQTRIEFKPLTGRTHQLRLHAAAGLGMAIVGDRLYGQGGQDRLYLHAREISFVHPQSGQAMHWQITTPF